MCGLKYGGKYIHQPSFWQLLGRYCMCGQNKWKKKIKQPPRRSAQDLEKKKAKCSWKKSVYGHILQELFKSCVSALSEVAVDLKLIRKLCFKSSQRTFRPAWFRVLKNQAFCVDLTLKTRLQNILFFLQKLNLGGPYQDTFSSRPRFN